MAIELDKAQREEAIASLQRYFRENMEEPLGNIGAGALLGFFIEEIGPAIYNQGVADAQARLRAQVDDLDIDVHEEGFRYWQKHDAAGPGRRKR